MMLALMASLLGAAPVTPAAPTAASDDPPIKVWLNQDSYYQRGDKAKVHVKLADDGYLVVLRADAEGRMRVLFPLDPTADDFVRGGQTLGEHHPHPTFGVGPRSEEHTAELHSLAYLVRRLLHDKETRE